MNIYTPHTAASTTCRPQLSGMMRILFFIGIILTFGSCEFYSVLTVEANPAGAGKVFVTTNSNEIPEDSDYETRDSDTASVWMQPSHTYYCYAQTTNNDYLWAGWFDKTTQKHAEQEGAAITVTATSTNEYNPTKLNYIAKWVVPKVEAVDDDERAITITDPTPAIHTENVVFTLTDDQAQDNFTLTPTGEQFYAGEVTYTTNSYAVPFVYNITGVHNAELNGNAGTPNTGTLTLESKYKGEEENPSSKTTTVRVTEDYTPVFTEIEEYRASVVGEHLITTLAPSELNYAALHGEWSFSLKDASHPYFSINDNPTKEDVTVLFAPTINEAVTCSVTFVISCTYSDRAPVPNKITTQKEVPIIITMEKVESPVLKFIDMETAKDIASLDMGEVVYPNSHSMQVRLSKALVEDIEYHWSSGNEDGFFTYSADANNSVITISLAENTTIGRHTATLKVSANREGISDELTVTADVVLATPVLEGFGRNGEVLLTWDAIDGASGYQIRYAQMSTTDINELKSIFPTDGTLLSTEATEQIIEGLVNETNYSFVVIAVYEPDSDYNEPSNIVTVVPVSPPDVITISNARQTGIYTGTEKDGDFPYKTKRQVDVSAAFVGEKAIFDRLYIFGLTVGDNNNNVTYDNAKTPCYIYDRLEDGETYALQPNDTKQIVDNMNVGTKDTTYFNISANNQKYYFTGYCPYASTGTEWNENGVVFIEGDGTKGIDIYLDSLQLYARPKEEGGTTKRTIAEEEDANDIIYSGMASMQGSGAVFTLNTNSMNFAPNIHIHGHNSLKAAQGMTLKLDFEYPVSIFSSIKFTGTYTQSCSPIQCLITGNNQRTQLTIDDVWPTNEAYTTSTNTNGVLLLKKTDDIEGITTAPLIDLGNADTQVRIHGGQILLDNTANTPIMAYRMMVRVDKASSQTLSNNLYGTCDVTGSNANSHTDEQTLHDGGSLRIMDGTFSTASGVTTVNCPASTTIDGGSFNCDIKAGTSNTLYNAAGTELHKFTTTMKADYGTVENGKAQITNFGKMVDDLFGYGAGYKDEQGYHRMLSMYYVGSNRYGYNSLAPNNNQLHLMLPYYTDAVRLALQICSPDFVATVKGVPTTVGGGISTIGGTVDRLLYMEIDDFTRQALEGYQAPNNVLVSLDPSKANYETVDEVEEYDIDGKVYMLKPIVADEWMLFAPPFDVANVYVIESYPETQLKKDFRAVRGHIPSENVLPARKAQAQRLMDLYLYWYYEEMGVGESYDFFGTDPNTDPYGKFVDDWIAYEQSRKINTAAGDDAYTPSIEQLQHFTGNNATTANYYLYRATDSWTFDSETSKFSAENGWATVEENGTVMQQGEVYAMHFPHNVIGGNHNPTTTWDYWTGKYLLIESTDKGVSGGTDNQNHTIAGSEAATDAVVAGTISEGQASMRGNASFALLDVSTSGIASLWSLNKIEGKERHTHDFELCNAILPTRAGMLAHVPTPPGMRARTINYRTGEVTYETIDEDDTPGVSTGVPTIVGDITLIVTPTHQGISITPLKAQQVMVYSADGKMLFSQFIKEEVHIHAATGMYVVRGEREQAKVIKQ